MIKYVISNKQCISVFGPRTRCSLGSPLRFVAPSSGVRPLA